jgi:mevalonate kinase
MPALTASAPGKAILFGEHAVVYGQPAIAIPVFQVQAKAVIKADIQGPEGRIWIKSEAISLDSNLDDLDDTDPLKLTVQNTLQHFGVERVPAFNLTVNSTIPVASGLGSGAAVSAAMARAIAGFLGQEISNADVSDISYESEKIYHGTPSGIDNTVVSFAQAVYFEKGAPLALVEIGRPFSLLISDTGISSNTKLVVDDVRAGWKEAPQKYENIFKAIGELTVQARKTLRLGNLDRLGELMNMNQVLLQEMGVSSPELDRLYRSAIEAGALGAKISGGGRGGNLIVLSPDGHEQDIESALKTSSAVSVIQTRIV